MRTIICFAFFVSFCSVASFAQDCGPKLRTARECMDKKDYGMAKDYLKQVLYGPCGDYDGNVAKDLEYCVQKLVEKDAVFLPKYNKLECTGEKGEFELELKKAPESWEVTQMPDWMQVSELLLEEKKVIFNINANPRAEIRKGKIILKSSRGKKELTVTQKEGVEELVVQTDRLSFGGGGGQKNVVVDANFNNWFVRTSAPWIRLDKQKDKLLVTCLANDDVKDRNTVITIFGKDKNWDIEVSQFADDKYFSVRGATDNVLFFGPSGGSNNKLRVDCDEEWYVENNCPWLKITSAENVVIVQCDANPWAENRTVSFEVVTSSSERRTRTILVEQSGAQPKLEKITLPYSGGERPLTKVRPHYYSIGIKGNRGEMLVKVYSNVQYWNYHILADDMGWITADIIQDGNLLKLNISDNNKWVPREAKVVINAMGLQDTLRIRQSERGYQGIVDDYFDGNERIWKTTRFFIDLYGAQSLGLRIGGIAKRWKFIEFSLLDFDVEYAYKCDTDYIVKYSQIVKDAPKDEFVHAFFFDWEPMVRGYLPLGRNGRRWAAYMGMGISVNLLSVVVSPVTSACYRKPKFLFEIGAEFNWIKKDNVSSRIFYRYDGFSSVGVSFDFYKWRNKY